MKTMTIFNQMIELEDRIQVLEHNVEMFQAQGRPVKAQIAEGEIQDLESRWDDLAKMMHE